jgi:hypothetical protein
MRTLGLVLCGLLLAACTSVVSGTPAPIGLTSAAALGDLRTIDYCTLLDTAGGEVLSSFEQCTVTAGPRWVVGPLEGDDEYERIPYDYPGDLPDGVRIHQQEPENEYATCTRWVGFVDAVWLMVAVTDDRYPAPSTEEDRCTAADELVAGVLTAIGDKRVGHLSYGPASFGGLDACTFLTGPDVELVVEPGDDLTSWPAGHRCYRGGVALEFGMAKPSVGRQELLDDVVQVAFLVNGPFCYVDLEVTVPDRPGLVQRARFSGNGSDSGTTAAELCPTPWAVAELVVPRLPQ